ncbi:MAG: hypothetical protein ACRD1G_11000, partial [Acidimicrobiales bacterium]
LRSLKAVVSLRFALYNVHPALLTAHSPAEMGMDLLLAIYGSALTPQALDDRRSIISTTPQHRIEWLMPEAATMPNIYCYDGHAMYLGCAQYSDGGEQVSWDGTEVPQPHHLGRYQVDFAVPTGYDGPGLLPVARRDRPGWDWPRSGEGHTWCSCAQARLAARQGWRVRVVDARLLAQEKYLAPWAGRLASIYERALREGWKDLAQCVRAVCLHTIGSMHRTGAATTAIRLSRAEMADVQPDEVITLDQEGHLAAETQVLRGGSWRTWMSHPELSAAVWAVAQYRVTKAMLHLPREAVLAVYGDALYTTEPLPAARDNEIGWLRHVGTVTGPVTTPRTWADLWRLTQ